jgi:glycosyltransferase involved in cell wall biosynthesis
MRIALIADAFPPLRTSSAVLVRDLAQEFARQGHATTVLVPAPQLVQPWQLDQVGEVRVLRLRAPRTKDIGFAQRALAEFALPWVMRRHLLYSPLARERWDGVVWYSPTIFLGPLAGRLKRVSGCRGYLIVRDVFPEWAVDLGVMGRGIPYRIFKAVARHQYSIADTIGVQTEGNLVYFRDWSRRPQRRLEVLHNWLADPAVRRRCSIRIDATPLAGRKIFVYAGNMGIAQGMDVLLELAARFEARADVGFVFVGRGSEAERLAHSARQRRLDNVLFHGEIDPDEIADLYAQCHIGLIALDPRHRSHNIPGKFLSYMQSGLPVLGRVNAGNDLVALVRGAGVGYADDGASIDTLVAHAGAVLDALDTDVGLPARCRALFAEMFSTERAVRQIVSALDAQGEGSA